MTLEDIYNEAETVEIDGKQYNLEYDFAAYAYLESKTGLKRNKVVELLQQGSFTTEQEMYLIHAAFRRNHPDYTFEQVGKIKNIADVSYSVVAAFLKPMGAPGILDTIADEGLKKKIIAMITEETEMNGEISSQ